MKKLLAILALGLAGCSVQVNLELVDGRKLECLDYRMVKGMVHCRTESGTKTFPAGMVKDFSTGSWQLD